MKKQKVVDRANAMQQSVRSDMYSLRITVFVDVEFFLQFGPFVLFKKLLKTCKRTSQA
jgi:hypothetical protein